MNLAAFYDSIRPKFSLTKENVDGFDAILKEAEKRDVPLAELAYMLATVWLETAKTMQPIKEYGNAARFFKLYDKNGDRPHVAKQLGNTVDGDGVRFAGRGYVQLTGRINYAKASKLVGKDLLLNPDLALEQGIAFQIMFDGMKNGWFTGRKFGDYIDNIDESDTEDMREFKNARRIINGTDKAELIATYALGFEKALKAAGYAPKETEKPTDDDWLSDGIQDSELSKIDTASSAGFLAMLFNLLLKYFRGK